MNFLSFPVISISSTTSSVIFLNFVIPSANDRIQIWTQKEKKKEGLNISNGCLVNSSLNQKRNAILLKVRIWDCRGTGESFCDRFVIKNDGAESRCQAD